MVRWVLGVGLVVLYVLHQDAWFWDTARPLVFGFLPIGLFYHVVYSVVMCLMMLLLVRYAWPSQIEHDAETLAEPPHTDRAAQKDTQ